MKNFIASRLEHKSTPEFRAKIDKLQKTLDLIECTGNWCIDKLVKGSLIILLMELIALVVKIIVCFIILKPINDILSEMTSISIFGLSVYHFVELSGAIKIIQYILSALTKSYIILNVNVFNKQQKELKAKLSEEQNEK